MEAPSVDLIARWQDGDQDAADALFHRYVERLLALAQTRLPTWLARHVDAEDVVQSAYRSFFTGARAGRYVLARSGDLWRLLVAITVHKLQRQVEHHTAGKRSVFRQRSLRPDHGLLEVPLESLAREPTPAEAAAVADTLERICRNLAPLTRQMFELRLQGYSLDEIATRTSRCERTVRRLLEQVKERLQQYQDRTEI